jgi:Kef-type K+ transport system membrane component KefB
VNTVFAYVLLTLLLPFLHLEHGKGLAMALLHPIYLFAGSVLAGAAGCAVLLRLAAWLGKREDRQSLLLVATVVVTIGVAHTLNLSVALALITLGVLARNRDRRHALLPVRFGPAGELFYVILFVLTGASLELGALGVATAAAVAAFILMRFLGKALACVTLAPRAGLTLRSSALLAVALVPLSGQAVVMVRDTVTLYPSFGAELSAVVLSAVVVLELLGPIATQLALKAAGEARP